ncbi:MAG: methyltransferase domain-containing protein [Alphaproteobacteria bacterium]|nr:methyltransferase domain-containing protein [Alphaproteobacteria bacterium]
MVWDPEQYLKFADHRLRPAADLLMRVDLTPRRVADLGAGAGNVTRLLTQRWPEAAVTAVESSIEMVERGRATAPEVTWLHQNLDRWQPAEECDLIFSNAALHWLDDHAGLFPRLMRELAPGGVLAVQMPRNFSAPSHVLAEETVRQGPWSGRLAHLVTASPVAIPAFYHALLTPLARDIDIWETEYLQVLEGENPVREWTKGTWLTRFLDALEGDEKAAFEADYAARVAAAYPKNAIGQTLFPFRRLFMVARRNS